MKLLIIAALLFVALAATAQTEYSVERDSVGRFLLLQSGQKTAFDTAYIAQSCAAKAKEEAAIKAEIDLIERLILLRRQVAVVGEEKRTLEDILKKSRNAKGKNP